MVYQQISEVLLHWGFWEGRASQFNGAVMLYVRNITSLRSKCTQHSQGGVNIIAQILLENAGVDRGAVQYTVDILPCKSESTFSFIFLLILQAWETLFYSIYFHTAPAKDTILCNSCIRYISTFI